MRKNIIISGKIDEDTNSIDLNEGLEKQIGPDWKEKWKIEGGNIYTLDEKKGVGLVRVSLLSKEGDK